MHSGAKTFPASTTPDGEEKLALIIGLSGTGKTTTTFRNVQNWARCRCRTTSSP
jgi:phosphoenolpyruvate carboxykinase (ATP)